MATVRHRSWFEVPAAELFAFHVRVANVARIQPPLPRIRLVAGAPLTHEGDLQDFELALGPLRQRWTARITRVVDVRGFEDVQVAGPFRSWRHQHVIRGEGERSCLSDRIEFELAGRWVDETAVRIALALMLRWRHWRTRRLLRTRGGSLTPFRGHS